MPMDFTASLRARLEELDDQLRNSLPLEVNLAWSRLVKEKEDVKKDLDAVVYPILTLPVEITALIFLQCLPDKPTSPHELVAPMLLTQICRHWREVAHADPRLWTSLKLDGHRVRGIVKDWLPRAGSLPQLHSLVLGRNDYFLIWDNKTYDPFSSSKGGRYFAESWANLTCFSGQWFGPNQCFEILRNVPHLLRCEFIDIVDHDAVIEGVHAPLIHANLESLVFRSGSSFRHEANRFQLFRWLQSPALRTLDLGWYSFRVDAPPIFKRFLKESPAIDSFAARIDGGQLDRAGLVCVRQTIPSVLEAMPSLTHLALDVPPALAFDILGRLRRTEDLLPRIQNIAFAVWDWSATWETPADARNVLAGALSSRSGLRELALGSPPKESRDLRRGRPVDVDSLRDEFTDVWQGVKVRIGCEEA
ncbi:hypothetical protein C8R43DRAFT_984329 [Mycena crocata]|nr:hypothetical protein C8R43DRAFT_984329 [Mycena crocata]